ncbi:uncharacterized protein TNCV_3064481 [Trichonephila clavipes]|nr:uncharacterized protein TNCV_3064481 [Trichonephila clavipes]
MERYDTAWWTHSVSVSSSRRFRCFVGLLGSNISSRPKRLAFTRFSYKNHYDFFNKFLACFARQKDIQSLDGGNDTDQSTLNVILSKSDELGPFQYQSPRFGGELARQWILRRRPLPKGLAPLPHPSFLNMKQTTHLYDVTCKARGEYVDPLSMYLVPAFEYVNAVHFQSDTFLEAFVQARPHHALTQAVE